MKNLIEQTVATREFAIPALNSLNYILTYCINEMYVECCYSPMCDGDEVIENISEELLVMCDIPSYYVESIDITLERFTRAEYKVYTKQHLKSLYMLLKKSNYKAKCDNENLVDLFDMVKDVILDFTFE